MNARLIFFLGVAIGVTSCAGNSAPAVINTQPSPIASPTAATIPDLTVLSENEWQENLGKVVMARGTFSLWGMVGPFIRIGDREIYIKATGNYSWGKEYRRLEGKEVKVTGTLGFQHFEPSPEQHPPDYFYVNAETAKIELVK